MAGGRGRKQKFKEEEDPRRRVRAMEAKSFENRKKPMRNATSRYQQGAQRVEDNSKSGDTLVLTFRVLKMIVYIYD